MLTTKKIIPTEFRLNYNVNIFFPIKTSNYNYLLNFHYYLYQLSFYFFKKYGIYFHPTKLFLMDNQEILYCYFILFNKFAKKIYWLKKKKIKHYLLKKKEKKIYMQSQTKTPLSALKKLQQQTTYLNKKTKIKKAQRTINLTANYLNFKPILFLKTNFLKKKLYKKPVYLIRIKRRLFHYKKIKSELFKFLILKHKKIKKKKFFIFKNFFKNIKKKKLILKFQKLKKLPKILQKKFKTSKKLSKKKRRQAILFRYKKKNFLLSFFYINNFFKKKYKQKNVKKIQDLIRLREKIKEFTKLNNLLTLENEKKNDIVHKNKYLLKEKLIGNQYTSSIFKFSFKKLLQTARYSKKIKKEKKKYKKKKFWLEKKLYILKKRQEKKRNKQLKIKLLKLKKIMKAKKIFQKDAINTNLSKAALLPKFKAYNNYVKILFNASFKKIKKQQNVFLKLKKKINYSFTDTFFKQSPQKLKKAIGIKEELIKFSNNLIATKTSTDVLQKKIYSKFNYLFNLLTKKYFKNNNLKFFLTPFTNIFIINKNLKREFLILHKRIKTVKIMRKNKFRFYSFVYLSLYHKNFFILLPYFKYYLLKKKKQKRFLYNIINIYRALYYYKQRQIYGIQFLMHGTFDRHGRTRKFLYLIGRFKISSIILPILFDWIDFSSKYGTISLKIWMIYRSHNLLNKK